MNISSHSKQAKDTIRITGGNQFRIGNSGKATPSTTTTIPYTLSISSNLTSASIPFSKTGQGCDNVSETNEVNCKNVGLD